MTISRIGITLLSLFFAASSAQAGYYLVSPDPYMGMGCGSCEVHAVHHHYRHYYHPKRHYYRHRSSASISVYYVYPIWYGYRQPYPCGDVYVPQHCNSCGRCSQPHWATRSYEVYQATPPDAYGYSSEEISQDTATADDGGNMGDY